MGSSPRFAIRLSRISYKKARGAGVESCGIKNSTASSKAVEIQSEWVVIGPFRGEEFLGT